MPCATGIRRRCSPSRAKSRNWSAPTWSTTTPPWPIPPIRVTCGCNWPTSSGKLQPLRQRSHGQPKNPREKPSWRSNNFARKRQSERSSWTLKLREAELLDYDAGIAHNPLAITRNIAGSGIFDQFNSGCTQPPGCGQHRDRRAKAAHADVFVHHYVEQPPRVHDENALDCLVVFLPRDRVVLVMIHVAGSDQQHRLSQGLQCSRDGFAQAFEDFVAGSAKRNRDEGTAGVFGLQERQLHFSAVFGAMCLRVFAEKRESLLQHLGQRRIDGHVAQRRCPRALAHDGERMSHAGVVRAHQDATPGQLELRVHCAGHRSGIHVAGVRHDAAERGDRFLLCWEIGFYVSPQVIGIAGIKTACNCGMANRRGHERTQACSPSTCRHEDRRSRRHRLQLRSAGVPPAVPRASRPRFRRGYSVPTATSARYRAALFSRLSASARTVAFTPAFSNATRRTAGLYCDLRLFQRVFRFCPKESFKKSIKPASGTCRLSIFGSIISRTTVESTLGGGENEPGGSVNIFSTRA